MYFKTCEVCGTKSGRNNNQKRLFMAKFPLDEERCKQWVKAVGKNDLVYIPIEKLHMLRHICGKHFKPTDFKKKKTQLKQTAVPSLNMTKTPLSDDVLENFPLYVVKYNFNAEDTVDSGYDVNKEHNYCNPSEKKRQYKADDDFKNFYFLY